MVNLERLLVKHTDSIREVMASIDRNAKAIALVVDEERRLIATVTDGDIRRAILAAMDLDLPIQMLIERRVPEPHLVPVTARVGASDAQLLRMMNEYGLRHIPILDEAGRVIDVALLSDLVKNYELPLTAVIMAGGYGTRLKPLTEKAPKPMLPIGNQLLLERIINQLREAGIRRVHLATHYKKEMISGHFGDGKSFGVEVRYVEENQPLGTAGALSLLDASGDPILVVNGDILNQIDFRAMLDFHREHGADMTVGVRHFEQQIPYGRVETEGVRVTRISEKPTLRCYINAGIYLLDPNLCRLIPVGQSYDMPDLINQLILEGRRVINFPVLGYWLDIGHKEDYERAQADSESEKV